MESIPNYTLIRSRRKTISLSIMESGEAVVRAPMRMRTEDIASFVSKHRKWIDKRRNLVMERAAEKAAFTWSDGDVLPIWGHHRTLQERADISGILLSSSHLYIGGDVTNRQEAILSYLKVLAGEYLKDRVNHYAAIMKVVPSGVKISSAKKQWGSCSGRNSLCFSYRLIGMPPEAVDAVVVHELAHIRVRSHSPAFYTEITKYLPDYFQRNALLRQRALSLPF